MYDVEVIESFVLLLGFAWVVFPAQSESGQPTAVRPQLTFDSPMPIPDIEQWARGQAPDFNDQTKTFLISFWSTANTPARESLVSLSKFADEYRNQGLVVVGVTEESAIAIQPLLDSPRFLEGIRFAIGCDSDRSTYNQFMKASWQNTLPTAFLARGGKILWIGNSRDLKNVLVAVFAGKWSSEGRKELYEQGAAATKRAAEFENKLSIFIDRRQWDAALEVITEMENDSNTSLAREGRLLRISILQQSEKTSEALQLCDSLIASTKDWEVASEIAVMLASPLFPTPDFSRATIAALKGIAMSKQREARAYCALAEVQLNSRQQDLAIRSFERALTLADIDEIDLIQDRLSEIRLQSKSNSANTKPAITPPTTP